MSQPASSPSKSIVGFVVGFFLLVIALSLVQFYSAAWGKRETVEFTPLAPVDIAPDVPWVQYRNEAYGYRLEYPSHCTIQAINNDPSRSPSVAICGFDAFILDVLDILEGAKRYPVLALPLAEFAEYVREQNANGVRPNDTVSELQAVQTLSGPAYRFSMEGTYRDFSGQTFPFSTRSTLTFYRVGESFVLVVTRDDDARAQRMLDSLQFTGIRSSLNPEQ